MMFRWQPTNTVVQRNDKREAHEANCPVCGQKDDQFHYMKCSHDFFAEARDFAWRGFCQAMKTYKKQSTMLRIMWIGMQNWTYNDFDGELPKGGEITAQEYILLC